jgi:hypothetical protein
MTVSTTSRSPSEYTSDDHESACPSICLKIKGPVPPTMDCKHRKPGNQIHTKKKETEYWLTNTGRHDIEELSES